MTNSGEVKSEIQAKEEKKTMREKKPKEMKSKSKTKPPSHPPYFQMIKEAITALSEKGGSSPYAIAKYMEQNHQKVLPSNFRKILGLQLKNSVTKGKLIKIKASYKLSEAGKKREKTTKAARANAVKEPTRRRKSRTLSKIDNPTGNPTARRSKRTASVNKPKQLKSIKSSVTKKVN
ncbi:Histone H1 [Bienertia sinuspersici]